MEIPKASGCVQCDVGGAGFPGSPGASSEDRSRRPFAGDGSVLNEGQTPLPQPSVFNRSHTFRAKEGPGLPCWPHSVSPAGALSASGDELCFVWPEH